MVVVSNTSPISNLAIVGRLEFLLRLRLEAGFFADVTVEKFILSQVGE